VFENRYGTPRAPVEAALSAGQDVLFDSTGKAPSSCGKRRGDVVSVFILRRRRRPREAPASRAQGFRCRHSWAESRASHEMSHWAEYDYIIIITISTRRSRVQSILKAERLKRERRTGLSTFVRGCSGNWIVKQRDVRSARDGTSW